MLSGEPTYVYRKGEGWVATLDQNPEFFFKVEHQGRLYLLRLTKREPEKGERYDYALVENPKSEKDFYIVWRSAYQGIPAGFGYAATFVGDPDPQRWTVETTPL